MASTNYKEAFALFDKRGNGRVALSQLGDLLRACGQNPTLTEIGELEKSVGGDFDFEAFSKVLNRPGGFRDPGEPEEYTRGFQVFDKDLTGFIGVGQLRYVLTNLGEKMSDEEVDELLKAVDTSSGEINYTGICSRPNPDDPLADPLVMLPPPVEPSGTETWCGQWANADGWELHDRIEVEKQIEFMMK